MERAGAASTSRWPLYDAIFPSLASNIGGYFDSDGEIPERTGNRHGGLAVAPYNAYETADGWIAILCLHDRHWAKLCQIMDRRDLIDDERLSTNASRVKHMDLLDRIVGEWTLERTSAELEIALDEGAIPSAPVQSLADVLKDPQIKARGMFEQHRNADREWWTFGSPLRLTDSPPPAENVPARLGQHTVEILQEKLMLPLDQIGELTAGRRGDRRLLRQRRRGAEGQRPRVLTREARPTGASAGRASQIGSRGVASERACHSRTRSRSKAESASTRGST